MPQDLHTTYSTPDVQSPTDEADWKWVHDVACPGCGCVCDDLRIGFRGNRIQRVEPSCPLASAWYETIGTQDSPACEIGGEPADSLRALDAAARLLKSARQPLIFGLSRSSTDGQRAAVLLAEQLGAKIDTTASVCHGPSIMAIQQVGEATCTLGEVKNRADLVIFWGANPEVSHPRHLERYAGSATGRFTPQGRSDRTIVVVDTHPTATSERADHFFRVDPDGDFELIWRLRARLAAQQKSQQLPGATLSADEQRLHDLVHQCRYGIVFFGLGIAQGPHGHHTVEGLLRWVDELNQVTRFSARRLRIPGDVAGADSVLCWMSGFPFAVDYSRGYPRYNPGEYTADELLKRGEVDVCLLVGTESIPMLSRAASKRLAQIPTIVLDYPHITADFTPSVRFRTAIYGVEASGTAYRMDEVPVPMRSFIPSDRPTDASVLQDLMLRVSAESTSDTAARE